jgi:hypothetical protein
MFVDKDAYIITFGDTFCEYLKSNSIGGYLCFDTAEYVSDQSEQTTRIVKCLGKYWVVTKDQVVDMVRNLL